MSGKCRFVEMQRHISLFFRFAHNCTSFTLNKALVKRQVLFWEISLCAGEHFISIVLCIVYLDREGLYCMDA